MPFGITRSRFQTRSRKKINTPLALTMNRWRLQKPKTERVDNFSTHWGPMCKPAGAAMAAGPQYHQNVNKNLGPK